VLEQDPEAFERAYVAATTVQEVPSAKPAKAKQVRVADDEDDDDFTTVGKGGKAVQYTAEGIFQNLLLIQEARGKKVCNEL
jgi:translation initiation factor 3 subunit C